ncbi:MAG: helix-turn-helix domain-containing protein [Firmicutes bacterium]|nr:helix-turn-helix domain-containing protein [Bacillota bacterium]
MKGEVYNQSLCIVLRAANLYYLEGKSQREIADHLNISVPTVSRLLKRAKEEGVVSYVIPEPYRECLELEQEIKERYGLEEAIIVPIAGEEQTEESVKKAVALEGARYVQRVIKPEDILGIAWGGTMYYLIQYLNPCQKTESTFVTLHGSITSCDSKLEVRSLVRRIAMAFGGKSYTLEPNGHQDDSGSLKALMDKKNIKEVIDLFSKITFSVSGIGSFYPEPTSPLSRIPYLDHSEYEELMGKGVYGDIMLRFIDENGKECESDLVHRTLAIDMDTYRSIPRKLIVASGRQKTCTLRAALKGKLADVLIIDSELARSLMRAE